MKDVNYPTIDLDQERGKSMLVAYRGKDIRLQRHFRRQRPRIVTMHARSLQTDERHKSGWWTHHSHQQVRVYFSWIVPRLIYSRSNQLLFSSGLGHRIPVLPIAMFNVYPATKFAVTALTETLRQELNVLKSKIRVTVSSSFSFFQNGKKRRARFDVSHHFSLSDVSQITLKNSRFD